MQPYTRRRLVKDFATIIGVLLLPLIVYSYLLFPEDAIKVDVLFFTIDSGYFDTVQHMIWIGCIKLIHVLTFLIWRATIKSWWRNVLLLPVLFFIWQISSVFNVTEAELTSKNEFILMFILFVFAIVIIVHLILKFKTYIKFKDTYEEINTEIEQLISKVASTQSTDLIDIKSELRQLESLKDSLTTESYLKQLMLLKSKIDF